METIKSTILGLAVTLSSLGLGTLLVSLVGPANVIRGAAAVLVISATLAVSFVIGDGIRNK